MAGFDVRAEGVAAAPQRMTGYASTETHSSNYKAVELLGLGKSWLRFIPVNEHYQIDLQKLEEKIREDQAAGYRPICVIANAATTNTGAIDDLNALADICRREGIWLHVDGAFGALVALSPAYRQLVAGMERADSLAFDLHKWMYMPFEVACVLIRRQPKLELLADAPLNVVCFRYVEPGLELSDLNEVNQEVLMRLHERGLAVPSYTRLKGAFSLRISVTNHRSTREDFDFLAGKVVELAEEVIADRMGVCCEQLNPARGCGRSPPSDRR